MRAQQSDYFRRHGDRATEMIAQKAAQFIAREASTESLITVIRAQNVAHGERINIFVSVYPKDKAVNALAFLERKRELFSDYLKQNARMRLPRIDFLLDNNEQLGESFKN